MNEIVLVSKSRDMYDADGRVISETEDFWDVEIFNHRTMGELWKEQKKEIKRFHKHKKAMDNWYLEKGFSKLINTGDFLIMKFSEKKEGAKR